MKKININKIYKKMILFESMIFFDGFESSKSVEEKHSFFERVREEYDVFIDSLYTDDYPTLKLKFRILIEALLKNIFNIDYDEELNIVNRINDIINEGIPFELDYFKKKLNEEIHFSDKGNNSEEDNYFWDFFSQTVSLFSSYFSIKNHNRINPSFNIYLEDYKEEYEDKEIKPSPLLPRNLSTEFIVVSYCDIFNEQNNFRIFWRNIHDSNDIRFEEFYNIMQNLKTEKNFENNFSELIWINFYKKNCGTIEIFTDLNNFYVNIIIYIFKFSGFTKNKKLKIFKEIFGDAGDEYIDFLLGMNEDFNKNYKLQKICLINHRNNIVRSPFIKNKHKSQTLERIDYILSILAFSLENKGYYDDETNKKFKKIKTLNLDSFEIEYILWEICGRRYLSSYIEIEKTFVDMIFKNEINPLVFIKKLYEISTRIKSFNIKKPKDKKEEMIFQINYIFKKNIYSEWKLESKTKYKIYEHLLSFLEEDKLITIRYLKKKIEKMIVISMFLNNVKTKKDGEYSFLMGILSFLKNDEKIKIRNESMELFRENKIPIHRYIDNTNIISKIWSYFYFDNKNILLFLSKELYSKNKYDENLVRTIQFSRFNKMTNIYITGIDEERKDNDYKYYMDQKNKIIKGLKMNEETLYLIFHCYGWDNDTIDKFTKENKIIIYKRDIKSIELNNIIGCNDKFLNILSNDPRKIIKQSKLFYFSIERMLSKHIKWI